MFETQFTVSDRTTMGGEIPPEVYTLTFSSDIKNLLYLDFRAAGSQLGAYPSNGSFVRPTDITISGDTLSVTATYLAGAGGFDQYVSIIATCEI